MKNEYFVLYAMVLLLIIASLSLLITRTLTQQNNKYANNTITAAPTPTPEKINESISPSQINISILSPIPTSIQLKPTPNHIQVPKELVWADKSKNQVVFTFDAGSGSQSLTKILEVLKKYRIKGTFFLTGTWVENNQDSTQKIALEGHEIFNHTYTHPHLTQTSDEQIMSEFKKTDDLIYSLTGQHTKPYFRPPYGERNAHVLEIAAQQGYRSVYWTIDAWDWRESEGVTADQVKERVFSNLKPGTIYLFHVGDNITGQISEEVILKIQSQGYSIVSLSQGL